MTDSSLTNNCLSLSALCDRRKPLSGVKQYILDSCSYNVYKVEQMEVSVNLRVVDINIILC